MIDMANATCLRDKLEICDVYNDCSNTDLEAAFDLILSTAIDNHLSQEEMPRLVFWNVCARTNTIPLQENERD